MQQTAPCFFAWNGRSEIKCREYVHVVKESSDAKELDWQAQGRLPWMAGLGRLAGSGRPGLSY